MYPEYQVPPDQYKALMADQRGCVIGRKLANKFGWKIGDTFFLESFIPSTASRTAPSSSWCAPSSTSTREVLGQPTRT
jgi:putative ABC transport system permease protein